MDIAWLDLGIRRAASYGMAKISSTTRWTKTSADRQRLRVEIYRQNLSLRQIGCPTIGPLLKSIEDFKAKFYPKAPQPPGKGSQTTFRFGLTGQPGSSLERVKRCRAIASLNSSVRLHGYLFDKSVITLGGQSFGHMAIEDQMWLAELFASLIHGAMLSIQEPTLRLFLTTSLKFELMPLPKLSQARQDFAPKPNAITDGEAGHPEARQLGTDSRELIATIVQVLPPCGGRWP